MRLKANRNVYGVFYTRKKLLKFKNPTEMISNEDIFEYLQSVFTSDIKTIKKYVDMDKNPDIEKEVERMDGLGQSIYDRGVSQGISQGISQGEDLLGKLMDYLLSHQLTEEAQKAALNKEARQEMYKKYGIVKEE